MIVCRVRESQNHYIELQLPRHMPEYRTDNVFPEQEIRQTGLAIPAGLLVALLIMVPALLGIGTRYYTYGDFNFIHAYLNLFFSINLLICYWEVCLFLRRDYIEARTEYWCAYRHETGRTPAREFFFSKVPLTRAVSPTVWADVWATYGQYDNSYADRRTFGFNVDIANGFVTPIPTLILWLAYTIDVLPVLFVGIIGMMLFWQWFYVTSVYWVSFFVAKRQTRISPSELYFYIITINSYWVLSALLGLYVSICLILDGNYNILGY